MELVSIIIPIYNIKEYITECLESVINQSYLNIEIVLVDDGSTDGSCEIIDQYLEKDKRCIKVSKTNGGLSDARNAGIRVASGEYLFFLDGDDVIHENCIEKLLTLAHNTGAEIVISGLKRFAGVLSESDKVDDGFFLCRPKEALQKMLLHQGFGHEAPGKLYKRNLWKDIEFPYKKLYEDYATTYKLIMKANNVVYYKTPLYYYRTRENSIMRSELSENKLTLLDISDNVTKEITNLFPDLEEVADILRAQNYLWLMKEILNYGFDKYPLIQERIMQEIKKKKRILLKSSKTSFYDKLKVILLLSNKRVFYVVYKSGVRVNEWKQR